MPFNSNIVSTSVGVSNISHGSIMKTCTIRKNIILRGLIQSVEYLHRLGIILRFVENLTNRIFLARFMDTNNKISQAIIPIIKNTQYILIKSLVKLNFS